MSETQNKELAKSYDPASIEAKWYPLWEQQGYFKAGLEEGKPSFSIQLPPPNITGILHMGHAFNHSVMDSLTRFYRMNGYNTMWLPGTDHAGIASPEFDSYFWAKARPALSSSPKIFTVNVA